MLLLFVCILRHLCESNSWNALLLVQTYSSILILTYSSVEDRLRNWMEFIDQSNNWLKQDPPDCPSPSLMTIFPGKFRNDALAINIDKFGAHKQLHIRQANNQAMTTKTTTTTPPPSTTEAGKRLISAGKRRTESYQFNQFICSLYRVVRYIT